MPYSVKKIRGKYRVVKKSTGRVAFNKAGTPLDGGGHESAAKAGRQIGAIEDSEARRNKK